jgi:DNA (cytosine-5)-methyltransferase 1
MTPLNPSPPPDRVAGEGYPAGGGPGINLDLFGGPGGWAEALAALGLTELGIELDAAACATRRAAGHLTIRANVAAFPVEQLAGRVRGLAGSPPCTTFSAAGLGAGVRVMEILALAIRDALAGRKTRARRMREMARALRAAWWTDAKVKLDARLTRAERSARIWKAVRSAALVIEPARYIHACRPEWIALEQVPAVLPLWQAYATELRGLGYSVWVGKLNAADFGVPQTRVRAILIASRARKVTAPEPTHYDPRKGDQLWGQHWVSMAEALGMGATQRPAPTVTAGGTKTGGAEPFGHRDRDMLQAEQEAGRWVLGGPYRASPGDRTRPRGMDEPATTVAFGHSSMVLRRDRGAGMIESHGERRDHPLEEPAPTITAGVAGSGPRLSWVMDPNASGHMAGFVQGVDEPSPALTGQGQFWRLRNNNNNNACERPLDEPAGTLFFGHRSNWVAWVRERPATTVQGDPRVGRPGHKDRAAGGESQFAVDSVRITPPEAAALQSFRADYPWQGTKTKVFEQIGNAVPPLLAEHVIAMAAGIQRGEAAA